MLYLFHTLGPGLIRWSNFICLKQILGEPFAFLLRGLQLLRQYLQSYQQGSKSGDDEYYKTLEEETGHIGQNSGHKPCWSGDLRPLSKNEILEPWLHGSFESRLRTHFQNKMQKGCFYKLFWNKGPRTQLGSCSNSVWKWIPFQNSLKRDPFFQTCLEMSPMPIFKIAMDPLFQTFTF